MDSGDFHHNIQRAGFCFFFSVLYFSKNIIVMHRLDAALVKCVLSALEPRIYAKTLFELCRCVKCELGVKIDTAF